MQESKSILLMILNQKHLFNLTPMNLLMILLILIASFILIRNLMQIFRFLRRQSGRLHARRNLLYLWWRMCQRLVNLISNLRWFL